MKKRFLALFLCCVMVFTLLPAALTTAFADGQTNEEPSAPAQETTDVVPGDTGDLDVQPDGEQDEQDKPPVACTCNAAEGAAHAEDCPLYVAPEQPDGEQDKQDEQPVACTCNAAEGAAHAEDCPLYVNPEQPDGEQQPDDEQQPEEEQTDYTEVYEQLMAAETAEELDALLDSFADEAAMDEFLAWLDANDKRTALEEHIAALNEQETLEQEEDTAILPMVVPFTNVGPLLPAAVLRRANAPMAVAALDDNNGNGSSNNNNGLVLSKKAEQVEGGYKITMEAYATGQSTTTVSAKPADIVLVLDMSGSMRGCMICGEVQQDKKHPVYAYSETYSVDDYGYTSYFIQDGGGYVQVKYCDGQHGSWLNPKTHTSSWIPVTEGSSYDEHVDYINTHGTLFPKTNAGDATQGHVQFYTRTVTGYEDCTSPRIDALKSAVNGFIDNVGRLSPDSQIALVKFAGKSTTTVGNNTYRDSGYTYNYSQIVKNLTKVQGNETTLKDAVSALSPAGATRADLGMEHAKNIINKLTEAGDNGHNKVVVMFTDGEPTSSNGFENEVANAAIAHSKVIKGQGATVYTIGVFAGADGTPVTSLDDVSKTNKYMHLVSSNYKNATSLTNPGDATYPEGNKSYYLSAADPTDLNNIFQQISQETGGSSVQYGTETVIKDIVTPYFTMPTNTTDIKLFTADSDGSATSWKTPVSFNGSVTIQDNTVSVSGFSFKDNWCGNHTGASGGTTFHDGKKLIIEFTVSPRAGFLGGNGVPTNGANSGVYHDNKLVGEFPIPTVNVPIQPVTVTAEDKNVYLLGTVTEEQLKTGATATCGSVPLNLNKANQNYGLEEWQTKFVEITTTVTPKGSTNLTADTPYTISVTVKPNPQEPGIVPPTGTPATEKTGTANQNINVFKPELTFKDSVAYYGDTAPDYDTANLTGTEWKHGTATGTILGTAPNLDITYAPETGKIDANGKINTPNDFGVKATVKIGDTDVTTPHTTFQHTNCANQTCTVPNDYQFLIHVKTCTLTVKKELAAGTTADAGQRFLFTITSPNGFNQTVVVEAGQSVKITGLKVGTYTVTEDTTWSWRYETTDGPQTATLSADAPDGSVTVTNTLKNDKWVTTDVYCKNEFKKGGIKTIINGVPTTN